MDHFSSYAAAGNACEAEEERMDREAARLEELDRQAAEQARNIVNDDRVTPEMVEAISFAMDGGDDERDLIAAVLAYFDGAFTLVEEHARRGDGVRVGAYQIMRALAPIRAKVVASETKRIREKMEPTFGRPSTAPRGWVFVDGGGYQWGKGISGLGCGENASAPFATEKEAREASRYCAYGHVSVIPWTPEARVPARKTEENTP